MAARNAQTMHTSNPPIQPIHQPRINHASTPPSNPPISHPRPSPPTASGASRVFPSTSPHRHRHVIFIFIHSAIPPLRHPSAPRVRIHLHARVSGLPRVRVRVRVAVRLRARVATTQPAISAPRTAAALCDTEGVRVARRAPCARGHRSFKGCAQSALEFEKTSTPNRCVILIRQQPATRGVNRPQPRNRPRDAPPLSLSRRGKSRLGAPRNGRGADRRARTRLPSEHCPVRRPGRRHGPRGRYIDKYKGRPARSSSSLVRPPSRTFADACFACLSALDDRRDTDNRRPRKPKHNGPASPACHPVRRAPPPRRKPR